MRTPPKELKRTQVANGVPSQPGPPVPAPASPSLGSAASLTSQIHANPGITPFNNVTTTRPRAQSFTPPGAPLRPFFSPAQTTPPARNLTPTTGNINPPSRNLSPHSESLPPPQAHSPFGTQPRKSPQSLPFVGPPTFLKASKIPKTPTTSSFSSSNTSPNSSFSASPSYSTPSHTSPPTVESWNFTPVQQAPSPSPSAFSTPSFSPSSPDTFSLPPPGPSNSSPNTPSFSRPSRPILMSAPLPFPSLSQLPVPVPSSESNQTSKQHRAGAGTTAAQPSATDAAIAAAGSADLAPLSAGQEHPLSPLQPIPARAPPVNNLDDSSTLPGSTDRSEPLIQRDQEGSRPVTPSGAVLATPSPARFLNPNSPGPELGFAPGLGDTPVHHDSGGGSSAASPSPPGRGEAAAAAVDRGRALALAGASPATPASEGRLLSRFESAAASGGGGRGGGGSGGAVPTRMNGLVPSLSPYSSSSPFLTPSPSAAQPRFTLPPSSSPLAPYNSRSPSSSPLDVYHSSTPSKPSISRQGALLGRAIALVNTIRFRGGKDVRRLAVLVALNVAYSNTELLIGLISGKIELVSDAFHLSFGCAVLFLSLAAMIWGRHVPNAHFTFGLERLHVLAAFTNALFLIFLSFSLSVECIHAYIEDEANHKHYLVMSAIFNLVINLLGVVFFRRYARLRMVYRRPSDINSHAICLHLLSDSIRSAGIVLASCFIAAGVYSAEAICLGLVSSCVLFLSLPLLKASGTLLLQMAPATIAEEALHKCIRQVSLVKGVAHCSDHRFWTLVPGSMVGTISIRVIPGSDENAILEHVHGIFNDIGVADLTVQLETD